MVLVPANLHGLRDGEPAPESPPSLSPWQVKVLEFKSAHARSYNELVQVSVDPSEACRV